MTEAICEAFGEIVTLALARGVYRINALPGCWELELDEHWWLAVNGHREVTRCSRGVDVQPFSAYVEFNGWPAGVFTPAGGVLAAGTLANEATLIAALRRASGAQA